MKLRRGYLTLAWFSGLALLTYACSDDKKSSTGSVGATTTSTVGTTGTPGTTGATMGTTGATTGATSMGGTTSAAGGSTGMGGATTAMGGMGGSAGDSGTTGEAGQGGDGPGCEQPEGEVLHTFDDAGTIGGWGTQATADNEAGLEDSFIMRNSSEGLSCPGSLVLTIPFSVYGPNEQAETVINFTSDWTGFSTLYASVKVEAPAGGSLEYLNGIQLFANSAGYSSYDGQFMSARTWDDNEWHELSLDISEGTDLTDVNQIGVQLLVWDSRATAMAEDGGNLEDPPEAPETTIVYIDDIRLE